MYEIAGHHFDPITDLNARCTICQRRFSILHFMDHNLSRFPVCAGPPKVVKGSRAVVRIKRADGTWEELGTINNIEYGVSYDKEPVWVLGKKECECGARKTGVKDFAPGHSDWCPVKEKL